MARKYTLSDLVGWGHIKDYEARKLTELGFTDVDYEDRMSTIRNVDKSCNYQFWTSSSRSGYMTYSIARIKPYKEITPNDRCCRSLWQCIKEYLKLVGEEKDEVRRNKKRRYSNISQWKNKLCK